MMGSEDSNDSKLYSVNGIVWPGLKSVTLESIEEPEVIDHYCDHLPFIEGNLSFTLEDSYISKKVARPIRRWCRKKSQQKKRKLAKEKKHGLLHTET